MQNNRRYHKSRNKNRKLQMNHDSPEGEGEFLNESNDAMLTVSDSLGNMDPYDSSISTEIDRTLLDEFAGDSDLSAEHDFMQGDESAPKRSGASRKTSQAGRKSQAHRSPKGQRISTKSKEHASKSSDSNALEAIASQIQKSFGPIREELELRFGEVMKRAKKRGARLDKQIKQQPYYAALAAVVVGFTIARTVQNRAFKR